MSHSNYVTIDKFSELTGYTRRAVESKINKGIWAEGIQYRKAPDHRILINLDMFHKWVEVVA